MRPEGIAVLVKQLDQGTTELRQVIVDEVIQTVAGKDGPVLDDLYIAIGIDYAHIDVP